MKFIDELKNLYTTSDSEGLERYLTQKDVNDVWLIDYISSNEKTMGLAVKLNRFVGWLDVRTYRSLVYLTLPKEKVFKWNSGYIKNAKKEDSELISCLKRLYGWSDTELSKNQVVLQIPYVEKYYKQRWSL